MNGLEAQTELEGSEEESDSAAKERELRRGVEGKIDLWAWGQ